MIKSIHIKNFRQHKNIKFNFHSGWNVITGESAIGKSAVVRALRFVTLNKPQGPSIFPKDQKNPLTEVDMRIVGNTVSRMKGKTINSYVLDNTELTAFRNDVPEPIKVALNMEDFNFQLQFPSTHFLLDDMSGEVAAKLNQVTNLTIIDESRKKVNKIIDKADTTIKEIEETIELKQQQLKDFEVYPKELEDLNDLIAQQNLLESTQEDLEWLQDHLKKINDIEFLIIEEQEILKFVEPVQQLKETHQQLLEKYTTLENLTHLIEEIKKYDQKIIIYQQYTKHAEEVVTLIQEKKKLVQQKARLHILDTLLNDINDYDIKIAIAKETKEELSIEYDGFIKEVKICPLCKKPF